MKAKSRVIGAAESGTSSLRLRADFWVAAFLRRHNMTAITAVLRRRGAAEAGAIFLLVNRLDGEAALFGPAPSLDTESGSDRQFLRLHRQEWISVADAEARLRRESEIDEDFWLIEVESRDGAIDIERVDL